MVTSIQDFKNQADAANGGLKTTLDSIAVKIQALKDLIAAGQSTPAEQLALLDNVLTDLNANKDQAVATDAAANP